MKSKKLDYLRDYRLEHEGKVWTVDMSIWETQRGKELRVHTVHGDITTPLLMDALVAEVHARSINLLILKY